MVFVMRFRGQAVRWWTSFVASALVATTLVLAGGSPRAGDTITPAAATTYLCSGYPACNSAGYSDAGYGAVNNKMYWNMYSGHNCTNYAAYRIIKDGGPATRPWSGGGNASEWGLQMKSITDQVPTVGAIAWWGRYSNGSGSAGHVAYVEKVVSATEIIVSEDSWGGTFHWRRIPKSSGRWPTGFIHFVDKKLTNTVASQVTGTPQVGVQLRIDPGTWVPTTKKVYQWLADGVAIPNETRSVYTPVPTDVGKKISVRITASRVSYDSVTLTSPASAPVAAGAFATGEAPVLSGEPYVDGTLTATPGAWNPDDPAIEWRWYADNVRIRANGGPTLALKPIHEGQTIRVVAVARKTGYADATAPATAQVGPILAGRIEVAKSTTISGNHRLGHTLTAVPGTYTPADATAAHQWLRNGAPIAGATGATYRQTTADVGKRITLQTTVSRAKLQSVTETTPERGLTIAVPEVAVTATSPQARKATVKVHVTAPGTTRVNGWVEIRIAGLFRQVKLVDGVATLELGGVPSGERGVSVLYRGSSVVVAKRSHATAVVK